MAHVVIMGAGVGGMPAAYEMRAELDSKHKITVVNNGENFHFTPSNPWVGVKWRDRKHIEFPVRTYLQRKGIEFNPSGVKRVHPDQNQLELNVVGAVQGASCFGPAYEYAFIMETDLRKRKVRTKVPMTFVTSEPYIGHLGLGGVGDSKGILESGMRDKHIKWICNAKVTKVEDGKMYVTEHDDMGQEKKKHELPFKYSMMLPAFKGIDAVFGIEGLTNPRGFITVDKHQRNAKYKNIFAVGVCVAIPPVEPTPIPVGTPKTGYMIESMVTATV